MAQYDSDSSGDEENEYAKTNVVLGFAANEPSDQVDTVSHLGGRPDWIDPATPPSAKLARCKICNSIMVLLLQLNGDLPEAFPGHERRIYVMGCRQKACRRKEGSVRVLRGVRIAQTTASERPRDSKVNETTKPKPVSHIGESLFGAKLSAGSGSANPFSVGSGSSNPFSISSSTVAPNNPFAAVGLPPSELSAKSPQSPSEDLPKTFASALSLNNTQAPQATKFGPPPPPQPWPPESELPQAYPSYFLEDDMEWLDKITEPEAPTQMMDLDEGGGSGGGKEDKEVYESTIDKTFQKFADRLAQNPEQVIRYEFKGQPLLYSKSDAVGKLFVGAGGAGEGKVRVENGHGSKIPRCANCGAGRVFEVQLTPHAIMELERDEDGLDGMEWGTVIVGVCVRDCNENGVDGRGVGYVEEWAGVQWEELRR